MKRFILIAAFAASGLAMPASAQDARTSVVVDRDDLDLGRPKDVTRLDLRIARAASKACGPVSSFDLEGTVDKPRCESDAIAAARPLRDRLVAQSRPASRGELAAR